jgi:hypothetical protein
MSRNASVADIKELMRGSQYGDQAIAEEAYGHYADAAEHVRIAAEQQQEDLDLSTYYSIQQAQAIKAQPKPKYHF